MNRIASAKEIIAGYALAGVTLCLGTSLGMKINTGQVGIFLVRTFFVIAALVVMKYTFEWGRHRGFPVGRADGTIAVGNLVRNLVMSAIVFGAVALVFGPLIILAFRVAR